MKTEGEKFLKSISYLSTVKLWNIAKKNKLDAGIYNHGWHDYFGSYDYLGMDFKYKPYLYLYVKYKLIILIFK